MIVVVFTDHLLNYEPFSKKILFKSFVKLELSYVFTIKICSLQLLKTCVFSLVGNYLRPSKNSRHLILSINAVVLIVIIC